MRSGSSAGTAASAAATMLAARSSARTSARDPLKARPMGDLVAETMTASGWAGAGMAASSRAVLVATRTRRGR